MTRDDANAWNNPTYTWCWHGKMKCSWPLTLYMLLSVTCTAEYSRRKQSDMTGVMSESQLSANSSPESNVHRSWHHHPAKRK